MLIKFCADYLRKHSHPIAEKKKAKRHPVPYETENYQRIAEYLTQAGMAQPIYDARIARILDSLQSDDALAAGKHILIGLVADQLLQLPPEDHPRAVMTIKKLVQ